jgi:hypothetical protein
MLSQQGDNMLIIYQSCHAIAKQDDSHYMINLAPVLFENMTVTVMDIRPSAAIAFPASVTKKNQVVVNRMLRQQGDNTLLIYQSCHAIAKQDDSHYMINLAPVLFENMTVTFMDIRPSAAIAFPASVTKKSHVKKDEMTVTFSSIPVDTFSFVRP